MLNTALRSWLIAGWAATVVVVVVGSIAMGAHLSTTALLLAVGVAPAIVTLFIAGSAPSPSVAEILHALETKDGRR